MATTTHDTAHEEKKPVFTDEHPEYPFLLYNRETRTTKVAHNKEEKEKLAKDGFGEDPFPPEDPDALTAAETEQLQHLLAKAAKALAKLGKLSEKHEPDKPAAPVYTKK